MPLKRIQASRPFTAPVSVPEESGVVLAQMKKAYEGDALVLRLYESAGRAASVRLNFTMSYSALYEADLQEHNRKVLPDETLSFTPYEIKTVIVER